MTETRPHYHIPEAVLATELDGEAVLLHMDTRRYYKLNETATVIWAALERGDGPDVAIADLCGRFTVQADEAAREVQRVVQELEERELIVPAEEEP